MAIYLEYEGIKGNVTAKGYEGFIEILSMNFKGTRKVSMKPGSMSNREASHPELSEISINKKADSFCAALFKEFVTGSAGKKVTIHHVRTGSEKIEDFMSQELEDVIIADYIYSASGEGEPMENISLSYSQILVSYKNHDSSNKSGSPMRVGYDLEKAKPL